MEKVTLSEMAAAFNEWQRRYIEDPSGFAREWEDIVRTMEEVAAGEEPSYGSDCALYFTGLINELRNK